MAMEVNSSVDNATGRKQITFSMFDTNAGITVRNVKKLTRTQIPLRRRIHKLYCVFSQKWHHKALNSAPSTTTWVNDIEAFVDCDQTPC
ncbi:MAG: hypothetical protein AB1608_05525 [Thermoproteota archaeon]